MTSHTPPSSLKRLNTELHAVEDTNYNKISPVSVSDKIIEQRTQTDEKLKNAKPVEDLKSKEFNQEVATTPKKHRGLTIQVSTENEEVPPELSLGYRQIGLDPYRVFAGQVKTFLRARGSKDERFEKMETRVKEVIEAFFVALPENEMTVLKDLFSNEGKQKVIEHLCHKLETYEIDVRINPEDIFRSQGIFTSDELNRVERIAHTINFMTYLC